MSFDSIAAVYPILERTAFGTALQNARTAHLRRLSRQRTALLAGDGDGRFLAALLKVQPAMQVLYVDESARMLEVARARVNCDNRVRFARRDLRHWSPDPASFDLIATHFFLDCFAEATMRQIVGNLTVAARPGTVWLLADFQVPPTGWKRLHAKLWLALMYSFFRATTGIEAEELVDANSIMCAGGWRRDEQQVSRWGLVKSELWRLAQSSATSPS